MSYVEDDVLCLIVVWYVLISGVGIRVDLFMKDYVFGYCWLYVVCCIMNNDLGVVIRDRMRWVMFQYGLIICNGEDVVLPSEFI